MNTNNRGNFIKKVLAATKKGDNLAAYIENIGLEVNVQVFDLVKSSIVARYCFPVHKWKNFVTEIPTLFKSNFKVIVCNLYNSQTDFQLVKLFCSLLKQTFSDLGIRTFFGSQKWWWLSRRLSEYGGSYLLGDKVVVVTLLPGLTLTECKYTGKGFKYLGIRKIAETYDEISNTDLKEIVGIIAPKLVIFCSEVTGKFKDAVLDKLSSFKVVVDNCNTSNFPKFVHSICKHLLEQHISNQWLQPYSARSYAATVTMGGQKTSQVLVKKYQPLPAEFKLHISRTSSNISVDICDDPESGNSFQTIYSKDSVESDCHLHIITLMVDESNTPKILHQRALFPRVLELPTALTNFIRPDELPVIAIFRHSSVILVHGEDGYKFVDGWNGQYGKDLLISFKNKRPVFCTEANSDFKEYPSYVVYDLIKILSADPKEIVDKENPFYSFKITQDEDHPILLEFDHFPETRKSAPPTFLMAMLLRQHLNAIRDVIGEKPKKLFFLIFKEEAKLFPQEIERLEKNIKLSGELLNVDAIVVVC